MPATAPSPARWGRPNAATAPPRSTYAGHPLYTYAEDKSPGDATGNDIDSFGGEWYALTPSGAEPGGSSTPPPPTSY